METSPRKAGLCGLAQSSMVDLSGRGFCVNVSRCWLPSTGRVVGKACCAGLPVATCVRSKHFYFMTNA